jgi:phosphotransacetylase
MRWPVEPMLAGWCDRLSAVAVDGPVRVVFAEGDDPRVRRAANELVGLGVVPLLVCARSRQASARGARDLSSQVETTTVAELATTAAGERVARLAAERGWPTATASARRRHPVYLAVAAVDVGAADACVAGSTHATGEVIRAGLHVLGLRQDAQVLCSSFLMLPPGGDTMAFGDCAVVPEPSEDQLADIAVATAGTFETLTGQTPSVAMLSFSTKGSAEHDTVHRVRAATALVQERAPWLAVDGEMQFDAALVESVARAKAATSTVAGRANVFIFPNLAAGNIGYKIAERLGGARAFGPILQGLRAPLNDLSRGCSSADVVNVAVISALQAVATGKKAPPNPTLKAHAALG